MSTALPMRDVVVEASFDITGRGAAIVFRGDIEGLPAGRILIVKISAPNKPAFFAQATVEWALFRTPPPPIERAALLVVGRTKADVPPGTRVEVPLHHDLPPLRITAVLADLQKASLAEPWMLLTGDADPLSPELKREVPRGHPLYGISASAVARRTDNDDVLFFTGHVDAPLAVVHLTYSPETSPDWPHTEIFESVRAWIERRYLPDVADWSAV